METDRIIASIAAGQHAAVGRRQLLEAGVPAHVISYRVRTGMLIPVHGGVYRLPGSPVTWHQRIMAATLAAGGVASHRAAAFLHGLEGIEPRLDVTVSRDRCPHPAGVLIHRLRTLAPFDVQVRDGIALTRPALTLFGLAAVVTGPALERALDDALLRGLTSCSQLERQVASAGSQGRPGMAALLGLLAIRQGAPRWTQSEFERRLFALLRGAGFPLPTPQFEVVLPNRRRVYLDFAWADVRLALEAQSFRYHAGRLAWSRDQARIAILTSMGWRILPVTWENIVEAPDDLIATVRRARAS